MLCLENLAVMLAEKELEFDIQAKHFVSRSRRDYGTYCIKIEKQREVKKH